MELIEKALSNHFNGMAIELDRPISVRANSEVFHAMIGSIAPLEVAVKRCYVAMTKTPDVSGAREQFAALERLNQAFADKNIRYGVPTPLCLMPVLATFVMSWVQGESLTKKLHRPSVFMDGPAWFEGVGAWLGYFHQQGPLRRQTVNLEDRLLVVDELCASPIPGPSFTNALQMLRRSAASLEGTEAEVTWLHGDCKTDNFFLSGQHIYGIDISLRHENPVEYDLAQFWNNLDLLLSNPKYLHLVGMHFHLVGNMRSRFEKAFWRGYLNTGPTVSHPYMNWLRLNFLLSFWHETLLRPRPRLRTWLLNRMFTKLAVKLTQKIGAIQ